MNQPPRQPPRRQRRPGEAAENIKKHVSALEKLLATPPANLKKRERAESGASGASNALNTKRRPIPYESLRSGRPIDPAQRETLIKQLRESGHLTPSMEARMAERAAGTGPPAGLTRVFSSPLTSGGQGSSSNTPSIPMPSGCGREPTSYPREIRIDPGLTFAPEPSYPWLSTPPWALPNAIPQPMPTLRPNLKPKPKQAFPILDRMCAHPEIILRFCTLADPTDLTKLYSISKPLHWIVNSHFTTYIRNSAAFHAPDSAYIFPWRCYRRYTIKDPGFRHRDAQSDETEAQYRDVPGLKWLQMVSSRHRTCEDVIELMNKAGHFFVGPKEDIVRTLKKIWFLLDLPRSGGRIAVAHNESYFTNRDLFLAHFFFLKLDMRCTDPVEGNGETQLRKLMLGQRNLYFLRDLLQGKLTKLQLVKLWLYYDYTPRPENRQYPIGKLPAAMVGRGCLESWGAGQGRLMRPDEIVLREAIRRNMDTHEKLLDMVRWGYVMQSEQAGKASDMVRLRESDPLQEYVDKQLKDIHEWLDKKTREREMEKGKGKGKVVDVEGDGDVVMADVGEGAPLSAHATMSSFSESSFGGR